MPDKPVSLRGKTMDEVEIHVKNAMADTYIRRDEIKHYISYKDLTVSVIAFVALAFFAVKWVFREELSIIVREQLRAEIGVEKLNSSVQGKKTTNAVAE